MSGILSFWAEHGRNLDLTESIFVVQSASLTGVACNDTPTAYSATEAMLCLYNSALATASPGENQRLIPICLRLQATTVNTSGTSFSIQQYLDTGDRYTSGGTAFTPVTTARDTRTGYTSRTPKGTFHFGNLTVVTATSTAQKVGDTILSDVIAAADDVYELWWDLGGKGFKHTSYYQRSCAPVVVGRNCSLTLHDISPSASADFDPQFEFVYLELGHPRF